MSNQVLTLTDRDIFNKITLQLVKQGKPAFQTQMDWDTEDYITDIYSCAYSNNDGDKCAVGQIINEDWYDQDFEGQPCTSVSVLKAVSFSNENWNMTVNSILMLQLLQAIHDKAGNNENDRPAPENIVQEWNKYFSKLSSYFTFEGQFDMVVNRDDDLFFVDWITAKFNIDGTDKVLDFQPNGSLETYEAQLNGEKIYVVSLGYMHHLLEIM
jgi:hypothetical protein